MTDPNEFVAAQIGQQADTALGAGAPEADLAAAAQQAQATAGIGVTEADITSILAQIKAMQARLDAAEAQRQASAPDSLTSSVAALRVQLANHGDPAAMALGEDAAEAAKNATESGDTGPLGKIVERIAAQLAKNPPPPGDQSHYQQARDTAAVHLPDVIGAFVPPSSAVAVSGGEPVKVVAGSVVG